MEQPMLPAEFPEPVLTCDLIIKDYLTATLTHSAMQHDAFETRMAVPRDDIEATKLARAEWHNQLYIQLWHASIADLLIQIQACFPHAADQIARDFVARGEDEGNGEWIWEWATERGLDPEKIVEEAKAKIAFDKKAATPCANKSVAKGAKELRREKSAEYRETINLDAADNSVLSGLEHDIRTSLPFNLTGDAVVHYVSRHLYADGYRRSEPVQPLEVTEMFVDTTDRGFRALTAGEVNAAMHLPGDSFIKRPHPSIAPELTPITPEQATAMAEIVDLAQHLEGVLIEGTHEETQIYAEDALELATMLHTAG